MPRKRATNNSKPRSKRNAARDRQRLLDYFLQHPDEVIKNSTLRRVLGDMRTDSWTRRLRELREARHGGYTILSCRDRSDLRPDEYLFPEQQERRVVPTVRVPGSVRAAVLHRDAYTCQSCGLARGQRYSDGRTVTLHVAHNVADSHGGEATTDNCFTLCSRCNEAESNIGPDRPVLSKTMAQVRRLPRHEQQRILEYLQDVFK